MKRVKRPIFFRKFAIKIANHKFLESAHNISRSVKTHIGNHRSAVAMRGQKAMSFDGGQALLKID